MPRKGAPFGKDHSPWNLCDPAIKLTVNEVSDSSQTQPDRDGDDDQVGNFPKGLFISPGEENSNDKYPDQPSMERHPSMPDGNNLKRVRKIYFKIVEEDIAQAGSDD